MKMFGSAERFGSPSGPLILSFAKIQSACGRQRRMLLKAQADCILAKDRIKGPLGDPNRSALPNIFIPRVYKFWFQPSFQIDTTRIRLHFGMKMSYFDTLSRPF